MDTLKWIHDVRPTIDRYIQKLQRIIDLWPTFIYHQLPLVVLIVQSFASFGFVLNIFVFIFHIESFSHPSFSLALSKHNIQNSDFG